METNDILRVVKELNDAFDGTKLLSWLNFRSDGENWIIYWKDSAILTCEESKANKADVLKLELITALEANGVRYGILSYYQITQNRIADKRVENEKIA